MESKTTHIIEVSGEYACFTRPDLSAERYTYDTPTVSAMRSILQSIYWKPQFEWVITKIEIINPIVRKSIFRNEISSRQSSRNGASPIDAQANRTQRMTTYLFNVRYRVHAYIRVLEHDHVPANKMSVDDMIAALIKHDSMFARRASKGQFFSQAYLGQREFIATTRYITDLSAEPAPADINNDYGMVAYDWDYRRSKGLRTHPKFGRAIVTNGNLEYV